MRLFIAVSIGEENKNKIFDIQSVLKRSCVDVKWIEKDNLHLTLKFLGEVAEDNLDSVKESIRRAVAEFKRFQINLESIGVFPNEKSPRVLWMGINKGEVELKNISQNLEGSLEELGFKKETREFSAHLTIGRFRSNSEKEKLFKIIEKFQNENIIESVNVVYLIKSTLSPKGPAYDVIEEYQLGL
ncbi:MAG TPA: RNA 2',3'-cyclic phosphodiesterase [Elusimicrobia bacterium]|nr:RNA 2',3'-cyclic phosphodiesterase [Elusimicrobiota bacterium]